MSWLGTVPAIKTAFGLAAVRPPTDGELAHAAILHEWGFSYVAYATLVDDCTIDRAIANAVLASEIHIPNVGGAIEDLCPSG
jgi:hypothetical protein